MSGRLWDWLYFFAKTLQRVGIIITYLAVCVSVLQWLTACSGPAVTALDVEIARAQAEAARACYAARQIPDYADVRDAALIMLAQSLSGDPCRQTNVYDSRAAIAAGQNQAATAIVGNVATAGVTATGIVAGASTIKAALKSAGGSIVGDRNIVTTAEGRSRANGPDQSSTSATTTTTTTTPEAAE